MLINKYGAVDIKEIVNMQEEIRELKLFVDFILGELGYISNEWGYFDLIIREKDHSFSEMINKLKKLTKVDDYEYKTEIKTKLTKKN